MSLTIVWSPLARDEYAAILEHVDRNFGTEVALALLDQTERILDQITRYPFMHPASQKLNTRKAVISKQSSLIYRIKNERIEILHFWDNRRNTDQLEKDQGK